MTALDKSTKQRIVGTLVILIVAIVLLPIVFDGQGSYQLPLDSRIPTPAPFSVPPPLEAERPVIVADTPQIRVQPPELEADPEPATTEEPSAELDSSVPDTTNAPKLDSVGLAEGWSVRLASFSNAQNASNLIGQLEAVGHRAYQRELQSAAGQTLTAVYVGPVVDRSASQSLQRQLMAEFQLSGMIVRYEIDEL